MPKRPISQDGYQPLPYLAQQLKLIKGHSASPSAPNPRVTSPSVGVGPSTTTPTPPHLISLILAVGLCLLSSSWVSAEPPATISPPFPTHNLYYSPSIVLIATSTAYNSEERQTDSTPWLTSTLTPTRAGVIAASRDLLDTFLPYGTKVRLAFVGTEGSSCRGWMPGSRGILPQEFVIEDTMHPRMQNRIDIWMPTFTQAKTWGVCEVMLEILPEHTSASPTIKEPEIRPFLSPIPPLSPVPPLSPIPIPPPEYVPMPDNKLRPLPPLAPFHYQPDSFIWRAKH